MDQNDNRQCCKRCGIELPESQVRSMTKPEYNEWYRDGYCSYTCFKNIECKSAPSSIINTQARLTDDPSHCCELETQITTNSSIKTTNNIRSNPPLPVLAKIAGIIWGIESCMFIITGIISLLKPSTFVVGIVLLIFGAALARGSERTLRGKAKSTLGNGLGSLVFGVIFVVQSIPNIAVDPSATCSSIIFSVALLVAGVLALLVRGKYEDYLERCHAVRLGYVNDNRN